VGRVKGDVMNRQMKWFAGLLALMLVAAACTAGGGEEAPAQINRSEDQEPVTIDVWIPFSAEHEVAAVQEGIDGFEQKYPWITVKVTDGVEDDDKILAAIRAGNPPDAVMSWALDDLPVFCDSGAWQDLSPYIERSGWTLDEMFPASVAQYTGFGGSRCALPFLTDAIGLYYNKDLFEKAGISEPPTTTSELVETAKKLTEFNPDGSIKVAGFVPWIGYYENDPLSYSIVWDADYYTEDMSSAALATDPDWASYFEWWKDFVDFYGSDNIKKFVAGQGDEWSSANDFHRGRVAMMIDGEWRTAFIENDAPDLNYGTAPVPVPEGKEDLHGIGRVGGTIMGIPRGSAHAAEAWLLVEHLGTNTDALVTASNTLRNVPTTLESLEAPQLDVTPQFETFMNIFENPGSHYKQMTVLGSADQDLVSDFAERWQNGRITDLQSGLEDLEQQLNDLLEQS
jgi:multiple sugar transport system substrate-binding protein